MKRMSYVVGGIVAGGLVGGCGLQRPQVLSPAQFVTSVQNGASGVNGPGQPVNESGALTSAELHAPLLPDEYTHANAQGPLGISPQVRRDIPAPGQGAGAGVKPDSTTTPTTAASEPAQADSGLSNGYQVVGTVLARVDRSPIFADKVLASLERELAAEARKFGPDNFRRVARQDIESKIQELIHNQLEIERADASLPADSKMQAQMYAQAWRRQQIAAAGGSEAVARQRALENGEPFDDMVDDQKNIALVQLYYQTRVAPKIQVTAADMRKYYDQHLATEFSKHAEARISLIRVDFTRSGGADQATAKANRIIQDLKGGTVTFDQEAHKYNDDAYLMEKGGDFGWIKKGAGFKYDEVEQAIWKLQPGDFTDTPIKVDDADGSAYYIAKLVERRGGTVQPFDNPDVQRRIYDKLFSVQLAGLREKELADLVNKAVIFREPTGLDTAVDMAMQRYPVWASAR
ncbi:MAG TPA: peptidylprolyl isomerase [Tepidisphaeraceae bacterium]|nr:peptidylprolyl isomerase [Tepidisphaeraceae bacterium]